MTIYGEEKKSENGMMVVEASISFTAFLLVVGAIIYLTTIVTLHNRIQFAMNSAAQEISSYSYVLQALGIRGGLMEIGADGKPYTDKIDDVAEGIADTMNKMGKLQDGVASLPEATQSLDVGKFRSVASDAKAAYESGKNTTGMVVDLVKNPNDFIVGAIYMGASWVNREANMGVTYLAAGGLVKKYLYEDALRGYGDPDEYLKKMGVIDGYAGINFFGSSVMLDPKHRLIDLVCEYDVDMGIWKALLPEGKLHVLQRVTVPAWVDGDGQQLSKYGIEKK